MTVSWPLARRYRLTLALILASVLLLGSAVVSWAHPLGNFTTNRYARIVLAQSQISIFYVLDMAEIPAFKTIAAIDSNDSGAIEDAEADTFLASTTASLRNNLSLTVDGRPAMLEVIDSSLRFPAGQGGLKTVRLEMTLTSPIQAQAETQIDFRDDNGPSELGWREIIVVAEDGVDLLSSTAATEDRSQALTNYPVDLLQDPPTQRTATVVYTPGVSGSSSFATFTAATESASSPGEDPFADLINVPVSGPMALLLALLAAFVWGAAHAMSPGHGKTIVAAYLVGSRGTAKHALFLGLTTTVTHTAGVFALGGITLFASQFILPEQLLPWLSILSGLLVVGIGLSMFWGKLRPLVLRQAHHHFHEHAVGHHHTHDHGHHHHHPHHLPHHPHEHDHAHGDHHDHAHTHSHLPPGANGQPVTWRSLLALGISGGLLPCPSALVVMLGAIALGRIGFGLLLILVFSLGLASVLTLVGILMVHAGKLVKYVPEGGRLLRLAPIGSALFITIAGVVITVQAILQIGTLSL